MADVVRTFLVRLSAEGIASLFERTRVSAPDLDALKPRDRRRACLEAVQAADDASRAQIEGIANQITGLTARTDHFEAALRGACQDWPELLPLLDEDKSPEERTLNVWLEQPKVLDRARNLAQAFHWSDTRYHFRFVVRNPGEVVPDVSGAVESIRQCVQRLEGGRKVDHDYFEYGVNNDDRPEAPELINHIAIYLEQPASYLMEFRPNDEVAIPVLRRNTKELAIDYNSRSGQLDISGRGFGGLKMLQNVAEEFRLHALSGAEWTEVDRPKWPLSNLLRDTRPTFTLPDGFRALYVVELSLLTHGRPGSKLIIRAQNGGEVYDELQAKKLRTEQLAGCYVRSAQFALTPVAGSIEKDERSVLVRLSWPNGRAFDGATIAERRRIDRWLADALIPEMTTLLPKHST